MRRIVIGVLVSIVLIGVPLRSCIARHLLLMDHLSQLRRVDHPISGHERDCYFRDEDYINIEGHVSLNHKVSINITVKNSEISPWLGIITH